MDIEGLAMSTPPDAALRNLAARQIRRQVKAMNDHVLGARTAEDIEDVHQARIASRRLRAALRVFGESFSLDEVRRWRRETRRITRSLGCARDLDVHLEYLRKTLSGLDDRRLQAGVRRLVLRLRQDRDAAQPRIVRDLDRLEASQVLPEIYSCAQRIFFETRPLKAGVKSACVFAQTQQHILKRLASLRELEACLADPSEMQKHHQMRIAAKRLRYTMELCRPPFGKAIDPFIKAAKRMQSLLGKVHDRDVWLEELRAFPDDEKRLTVQYFGHVRPFRRLEPGIEWLAMRLHAERVRYFKEAHAAWQELLQSKAWLKLRDLLAGQLEQAIPPEKRHGGEASEGADTTSDPHASRPVDRRRIIVREALKLARTCNYERAHTHQVTRLALRLFDELRPLHGLGEEARFLLQCAGLLHDIGWIDGQKGHHKTAMRLILQTKDIPLDEPERRTVALIARYHRKALPSDRHTRFATLSETNRRRVNVLAAILRVADGLDRSHGSVTRRIRCETPEGRIAILCETTGPAHFEKWAALKKGDLLERVFNRTLSIEIEQR